MLAADYPFQLGTLVPCFISYILTLPEYFSRPVDVFTTYLGMYKLWGLPAI